MKLLIILAVLVGLLVFSGDLFSRVIRVYASVNPPSFTGPCPKVFEFTGKIAVDSPGVVKYKWLRSDNAQAPEQTINFNAPGTQVVTTTWTLGGAGMTYNGWEAIQILSPNPMTSNKAVFTLNCEKVAVVKPGLIKPGGVLDRRVINPGSLTLGCPDPAAHEIRFQIVRRYTQFRGRIRITGIVKNIGRRAFIAGANQAKAYLYQMPAGVPCANATGGTAIAERAIVNLAPDATIELSWERDWDSSSPSEGEFPNCYRLFITYDPDIYMDASKDNDDCNGNNNKKDRSGTEINDMLK